MPKIFLSPSTQYWNEYVTGGNEREYMNLLADKMEPYLDSTGIQFVRNDPNKNFAAAIADSNRGNFDAHIALHSNAAPEHLSGQIRGVDIYYAPGSQQSMQLAQTIADNLKNIYPLPDKVRILPTTSLGEVINTRAVAILAELGYHDNVEDVTWLKNNLGRIAKNLVESLAKYFGIPFIDFQPPRNGIVTTDPGSNLNMRDRPSLDGNIIASIPSGARVIITGETGDWFVVKYNNNEGYAYKEFILT